MRLYFYGLILGLCLGVSGTNLYKGFKFTHFSVPKFKVGDCYSNGLYVEKVLEIRKSSRFDEAMYVTQPFIQGRATIPDTTKTWIADDSYTLVKSSACTERTIDEQKHDH